MEWKEKINCSSHSGQMSDASCPTTAKAPPLSRIVQVPHCTAELSLKTRGKVFFLLFVEGGGVHLFNAQAGNYLLYIRSGAANSVLTANVGT
jgi:hypothetical protein